MTVYGFFALLRMTMMGHIESIRTKYPLTERGLCEKGF
jgi:hypothetical protein